MFKALFLLALVSAMLFIHGCASRLHPPPKPGMSPERQADRPGIHPYRIPDKKVHAKAQPARSVRLLMDRADMQQRNHNLRGAAQTLQRAIRIAPKNALLWHHLAKIRFRQQQYEQAEQLAKKSNALARHHPALNAKNRRLIDRIQAMRNHSAPSVQPPSFGF